MQIQNFVMDRLSLRVPRWSESFTTLVVDRGESARIQRNLLSKFGLVLFSFFFGGANMP